MAMRITDRTRYALLTSGDSNTKLLKSQQSGLPFHTLGLSLSPHNVSGFQTCASASKGCAAACLNTAGLGGVFSSIQRARIAKTQRFFTEREAFLSDLMHDIERGARKAESLGKRLAIRLNVFSDIQWERFCPRLFDAFPEVQFYDYTKHALRMLRFCDGMLPRNYHLTFSRSEDNWQRCVEVLMRGGNVAAVFDKHLPARYRTFIVIDGDLTDLRFLESSRNGVIVGLKAKGKARGDDSGFVLNATSASMAPFV